MEIKINIDIDTPDIIDFQESIIEFLKLLREIEKA